MTSFCGEYKLAVSTRCGDSHDYALRRIGHPVTVPQSSWLRLLSNHHPLDVSLALDSPRVTLVSLEAPGWIRQKPMLL